MATLSTQQIKDLNSDLAMLSNQLNSARAQLTAYASIIDPDSNDWSVIINAIKVAKIRLRDINYNLASSSLSNLHE